MIEPKKSILSDFLNRWKLEKSVVSYGKLFQIAYSATAKKFVLRSW